MFHALPDAQLAVIPGADHQVPQSRPEAIGAMVLAFLDGAATDEPGG